MYFKISTWDSDINTYGWARAEVFGALINSVFLLALCLSIFENAIARLITPETIHNPRKILYVGIAGLGCNVIGLLFLGNFL